MGLAIPPELQDLSLWPSVDPNALEGARREDLLNRIKAVRLYLEQISVERIEFATGVLRSHLYRLLRRCIEPHPDGRIRGFRALIPYVHAKRYERTKPVRPTTRIQHSGSSGAMAALLQRHDSLNALLRRCLSDREVYIGKRNQLCGLHKVHRKFIAACRAHGLDMTDYPLSQERHGIRSLAAVIRELATQTFASGARAAGALRVAAPWSDAKYADGAYASRPFEAVEFDGHKLDVRLHVHYEDAAGVVEDIDVNRVWLLVILDVYSRAVLGWNLVLSAEYDRNDVIRTVQQALMPQRKRKRLSIPGLTYADSGGFVGEVIPALDGACWERLRLDNARANLATDTLDLLCTVVGCVTEAGPLAEPTERPFVERFFGTLGTVLSHRLPGTTGTHPHDVRRRLMDPKGKQALSVNFDELLELVEVSVANYNGTPHSGIGARSPLEFLARATASGHGVSARFVPHPAPDELLGSWLLRVAQFYGLGLTTLLNRLDARPSSNARVEHWFTLGGACLSLDALSSASHLSRTYLAAMAPSACSPRWPKELGACAQCLTHKAQSGNAITWNRDWMSPLATMCSTHGTSLTPVATRTLAGIRHAGDFGVLVQQLSAQQRPEDKPTGASDALWLQDMCTARTAARPPWGRTRPHDLIRIVDVIAREVMAQSDSDSSDLGLPPDRQHGSVKSFTFVLRNGALVGISLPTQLRQRQRVMARVAHVLRLPCEERACCSPWSAASIKRLAWMHNWPDGALAWICPPAAKLVRHQEALQRQFSISPKYFKAYAALLASIR